MNGVFQSAWFFVAAFAVVAALVPLARRLALRFDFVDRPGGRKKHEEAVPPIGGLVIFPVFMILAAMAGNLNWNLYGAFFTALALLVVMGAVDDKIPIPPRIKFAVHVIAAVLIVVPGWARVNDMGNLFGFGDVWLGWASVPFSIVATVLLINAINLLDGLDGLAAGKGFIALFWITLCGVVAGQGHSATITGILMGALAGFLVYNIRHPWRARASVFLGDAGSLALGLSLAWFSIQFSKGAQSVLPPIAVAWILALPIFDTCAQFTRRVMQGKHPFSADHEHFHHHLLAVGLPVARATPVILALSFVTGMIGVIGTWAGVPELVLTYLWIAALFAHMFLSVRPHRIRRLMMRFYKEKI